LRKCPTSQKNSVRATLQKQAGDDGEVKRGVLAAMHDVAGESAEPEWEPTAKVKKRANDNQ
jgi:hypothetical protein